MVALFICQRFGPLKYFGTVSIEHTFTFSPFSCCLMLFCRLTKGLTLKFCMLFLSYLPLNKGAYPEILHAVFVLLDRRSF